MNKIILLLLELVLLGQVFGRVVTFKLIAFQPATVTVEGKTLEMKDVDAYSCVKSVVTIVSDSQVEYTYTVNGVQEGFTRVLETGITQTKNEFFGRQETLRPLKGMGYPQDKPLWTRSIGKTELFDDSYIPTVIFDNGSRDFFISAPDNATLGSVTLVLQDRIVTNLNVLVKAQNRYQDKFQFRVKLEQGVKKRKIFKFRANPSDPTFFRQSLYGDILQTIGNPVHNQIICRTYLQDGTPIGLYLMIEVTSSKSFIRTQFYGDEATQEVTIEKTELGTALDCSTGADFVIGSNFSAFQPDEDEGESNEKIIYLTDAMHSVDIQDENSVKKFSREWLDLDIFFKALAVEYLTGHWDSYWMFTSNFVMYDDPKESTSSTYKFYFIDQDFDLTFGLGLSDSYNKFGYDFPSQSYRTIVEPDWTVAGAAPRRAAIDKFIKDSSVTRTMFENHLIDIVKHVFNPVALNRRLEEYVTRYRDEVEWDYSISRLHPADPTKNRTRYVWSMSDFENNMESTEVISTKWGLKSFIETRAKAVADEFGFEWDTVPLDPPVKVANSTINTPPNPNYNHVDDTNGAMTIKSINISFIMVTLVSVALLWL